MKAFGNLSKQESKRTLPDNTASASTDGTDRRNILSWNFKELSVNVVLNIAASVCRYHFDAMICSTRAWFSRHDAMNQTKNQGERERERERETKEKGFCWSERISLQVSLEDTKSMWKERSFFFSTVKDLSQVTRESKEHARLHTCMVTTRKELLTQFSKFHLLLLIAPICTFSNCKLKLVYRK